MKSLYLLFLIPTFLFARQKNEVIHPGVEVPYHPWFTAPLLAPTAINMKPGHPAIQPSITIFNTFGKYDSNWKLKSEQNTWAINPLVDFQFGITDDLGIETLASFITNFKDGKSSTHFQDTIVLFGYQVSDDQKDSWVPDFRLFFQTVFPSGKYDRLDPRKKEIDSTGEGSYQIGPNLSFQKLFYFPNNFFMLHWSLGYLFPSRAKVRGFNAYGGGRDTKGKIRPGQTLIAFLSGEYSLNQRWVLAFDTQFLHQRESSKFSGRNTEGSIGLPSSTQISFAPEVEYSFAPNSGIIFGGWFTLIGRNADAFGAIFFAYLYIF